MKKSEQIICLWRYEDNQGNYPGYHLTANAVGCRFLMKQLEALHAAGGVARISLSAPSVSVLAVPNNQDGRARLVSFEKWRLDVIPAANREEFAFSQEGSECVLSLSKEQADCIGGGVADIAEGKGDYCIGGDGENVLWFWWFGV